MSDLHAALLADALNKYFCGLIREDGIDENGFEEVQIQVSLGDAFKSM
ncbi:23240_t:CDS:2 [Rhizophagus irregularis]|nr:23240_t:CDS:2 [Rhizophagus irregularis]